MPTEEEVLQDLDNQRRWNDAHAVRHPGALSGSEAVEVLTHHRVLHLVQPGIKFLDIGVGLGGMSAYLFGRGVIVDALDVADKAWDTVREFVRRFYVAREIHELPSGEYDLAVSMLVAQHMCERNLREQIRHVGRSLKPGGLFSLHLAGATEGPLNNLPGPIPSGMDGVMCRDPWYALAMIRDELPEGYDVQQVDHRMDWPQFKSYWYWLHIVRKP